MKNIKFSNVLSKYTLGLLLLATIFVNIFQNIYSQENLNQNTDKTKKPDSSQLSIDSDKKAKNEKDDKKTTPRTSDRVIVGTNVELVEDDACECAYIALPSNGFPVSALFAIGGVAFIPVVINEFDEDPPTGSTNVVSPSSP